MDDCNDFKAISKHKNGKNTNRLCSCSKLKKTSRNTSRTKKEEKWKRATTLLAATNDDKWNKSYSCGVDHIEIGQISTYSSKWIKGSNKLFVICLNSNSISNLLVGWFF